ncbi:phosphoethanolamine transferase [Lonepinella sp. BR2271]|uniref:phosphoethanolamine transferase n=1 Tax=Lonepinella sp. BR2271 TaxID=3434550 RepID=UPI003F6E0D0B
MIFALILLFFASSLLLHGTGFFPELNLWDICLLAGLILLLQASKKIFWYVAFPVIILHALYAPIGLNFGPPSYEYIASVFATDLEEGKEFFAQIPWTSYAYSLLIIGLFAFSAYLSQRFKLEVYRNKLLLTLIVLPLAWHSEALKFLRETYVATVRVHNELDELNHFAIESHWGTSQLSAKYDDYVLIIGESARRDYHHAYGYPVPNTPFMSSAKGVLIDGLTSGGPNTISSLKLMLTEPNRDKWEGNYNLNLIDLVKSAGIPTYWLSNQGSVGEFDTQISAIANRSDERFFLKKGHSFGINSSDFALLPVFKQLIEKPSTMPRFIVLHLYGSHPNTCDRVADYPTIYKQEKIDSRYSNINCYISSIKKTDELLKQVYESLQQNEQKNHRTFSMVYFSDHGLFHQMNRDKIIINNSFKSKRHYDIPLFKISSDDEVRHEYKAKKSGLNFVNGLANWIGIHNDHLDPNLDLFSPKDDLNDYGLKKIIEQIRWDDDPAVIIPE